MINKHQPPLASFKSSWTFVSQLQPSSNIIGQHRESWSCHQPSSTINNHLRIFFTHHHQPGSAIIALWPACTVINHQASSTVSIIDHHHKPSSTSPTSTTSCWASTILEQHQALHQLLTRPFALRCSELDRARPAVLPPRWKIAIVKRWSGGSLENMGDWLR